jgi:hypothetical protein
MSLTLFINEDGIQELHFNLCSILKETLYVEMCGHTIVWLTSSKELSETIGSLEVKEHHTYNPSYRTWEKLVRHYLKIKIQTNKSVGSKA